MFEILTDKSNIQQVFEKYSLPDALKVKQNLSAVFLSLKIPSQALIDKMAQEGIALADLDASQQHRKRQSFDIPGSVVRSNLFRMFLNKQELLVAMEGLTTAEKIEVRDVLHAMESYLKLPSADLMSQMAQEGLIAAEYNTVDSQAEKQTKDVTVNDNLANVKSNLSMALGNEGNNVTEFPHLGFESDKLLSVKNKLNALVNDAPEANRNTSVYSYDAELEIEGSAAKKFILNLIKT